ncbi:hypothetical protein BDN71DRAFT_1579438 [Pleurotus eryngii]|uniref:Uncharacterized protein n=1 Tax=Pleurotus eryngii TaxID=5323 RepID=A0A9P5ZSB8_PLEER|nr:hypothetical protein BDN71DRAFT_1579438 [Pleurotus eryngii]
MLEEVFAKFHLVPDVGSSETHDGYFRTLPSGSKCLGDTLDQAAKIRNAQFPLIFNLQPLTPIEPKDDGDILHITSANCLHDHLASVFRTPKLSEPLISTHTPHQDKAELTGFAALDRGQSSLCRSSADTQSLPPQNVIYPHMPHNKSLPTSDDEVSLGGKSTKDLSSDDKIPDDHPHISHHASLAASDDEASLGGQSIENPSSDDEMANDESMEENTPGIDLSHHSRHTLPAVREAEDDEDDGMSLGGYTDNEANNSHTFSMVEMQANISNIPSSSEVGCMGSPIDEVDDAYLEYLDDSDGDVNIPDDVQAYLQTFHTLGFQLHYQHVHFEHIPDAKFADDVL